MPAAAKPKAKVNMKAQAAPPLPLYQSPMKKRKTAPVINNAVLQGIPPKPIDKMAGWKTHTFDCYEDFPAEIMNEDNQLDLEKLYDLGCLTCLCVFFGGLT